MKNSFSWHETGQRSQSSDTGLVKLHDLFEHSVGRLFESLTN